ncbi:RHS repeat-associated core domain-containing protein [Bacteroides caccae]
MGRVTKETMGLPGGDRFMEVMSVESEYNAYGERIRVVSSLGADTELSYDRIGLVGGIKATVGKTETDEASAYGDAGGDVRPWESTIGRDDAGREVERFATGGIRITTDYNDMGLVRSRHVRSGNRHTGWRSYRWDVGARLMSMRGNLSPEPVIFDYDSMCNLVRGDYSMHESVFRTPDKVGNLYREDGCKGREYDRGGRLLWDGEYHYRYDCEGNLVHKSRRDVSVPENNGHTEKKGWLGMLFSADDTDNKDNSLETDPFACWQPGDTCYEWQANGMLAGVRTPDGRTITFGYDALGRRVSKRTGDTVHRFGWDGNVVLHEWDTDEALRPRLVTDETGREEYDGTEKPEGLVTWVYDGTSFTPVAKVTDGERYTIVHDYLGTPTQAYDSKGELVWEMLLDVYGKVEKCHGDRTLVPFRYQGQYEDEETGLYYNRFRYYSPDMGMYISSDPIGLAGNNPTLYGYVLDVNTWLDVWGLYNGEGERTLGIYDVYHSYNLSVSNYTQSDSQQFSLANESLYKRFEADPDFANQMEAKYPGIKDHVSPGKKGGFSTDAPPGTTWHHSDTPGILELVDRNDHQKYHKIYHPDGSGGRKKWGGGTICR